MSYLDPEEWTITPRAARQALDLGMSPGFIIRLLTEPSLVSELPADAYEFALEGYSALVGHDPLGRKRVQGFHYGRYAAGAWLAEVAA